MQHIHHPRLAAILTTIAAALISATAVATDLTGTVIDTSGEPLPNATVRLLRPDSTFIRGAVTDFNGLFRMADVNPGRYILATDYTGFSVHEQALEVTDKPELDLGKIKLSEKSNLLKEVSVTAVKTQVKVMEDTIQYNADSYQTRPNAVVEDLIKRLPGVEVSSDGKITANGQEIKKILVDGKEFFGDDPTVASKNIPVDIVDKLQIIDRKSDLARLTGVDDGEDETVINLTVKKGHNNGWFGNAEAGYGTDRRYSGNFTVNRFKDDDQFTILGNANNINQQGFNDGNAGRFGGWGFNDGITTTQSLGMNFNVGREEIIRVGGNVFYGHNDRLTTQEQTREYLLGQDAAFSNSNSRNSNRSHNINSDFRILWKPDSFNTLEARPRLSFNHINTDAFDSTDMLSKLRDPLSTTTNDSHTSGNNLSAGLRLIYNHNFRSHRGRSFSVHFNVDHNNTRQEGEVQSWSEFFASDDEDLESDQLSDNRNRSTSLTGRLSWTEPLGNVAKGHFLTLAYRASYRWNNADKIVDELNSETGEYEFSDRLSNRFRNTYFNQDIRVGYKRVTKVTTLDAGVSLVPQMSQSTDLIDHNRDIPARHTLNFAPYLRLRIRQGKKTSLNINYFGRSSQPSLSQLQPVADVSDPMNIKIGNPELSPSFSHDVRLRFQDFNADHQRSIMAMLMGRVEQNTVVSRTDLDTTTGARTTTYENVNGVWWLRLMNMVSMPLGSSKAWLMTSHVSASYNHSVGYNNGLRNNSGSFRFNLSPSIAFRPSNIDLELRPFYSLQNTRNSLESLSGMTVHTYGGSFNGSWYTPWGLVLNTDLNYTATSGYASGYNDRTWMWNASISYQFLSDKSLVLTAKAYDLLGQKSNVRRNITANYIDDTRYNTLTRYFMVTLSYSFNTFGKGNTPERRDDGPFGPGFGGPGPRGPMGGPGPRRF